MRIAMPRLAALLGLCLLGCGPDFDPPSELHSLRVLGVQKDVPYAQPGQKNIQLQMLWTDASLNRPRPVKLAWSAPCFDPPGDLYYGCFSQPGVFDGLLTVDSDTVQFDMPTDIISRRPVAPSETNNAPYGIAYVFFALCAGDFAIAPATGEAEFPLFCNGPDGKHLGSDDFVAGYTSVYSFKDFSNNNPVVTGFRFNGTDFSNPEASNGAGEAGAGGAPNGGEHAICLNDSCTSGSLDPAVFDFECADHPERCMPTCAGDGDSSCKGYSLQPLVDKSDPKNQEQDDVSVKLLGRQVGEQMWINYYTEAGGFKSPVRLLNDATTGWNDNFATEFYAPKTPGPFRVWSLVHDNRGGVAWSGITLQAE